MQPRDVCHNAVVFCHTSSVALAGCAGHGCCVLHGSLSVEGPLPARFCCGGLGNACIVAAMLWRCSLACCIGRQNGRFCIAVRPVSGCQTAGVAGRCLRLLQVAGCEAFGCGWAYARRPWMHRPRLLAKLGGGRLWAAGIAWRCRHRKYVAVCLQVCNKISIFAIMTYNWAA